MKTGQELLKEHMDRVYTAFNLEKPDRTPILVNGDYWVLKYGDPTAVAADYVRRPEWAAHTTLEGLLKLGNGECDAITGSATNTKVSGMTTLAKSKVPGIDLKDDSLWQVDENGYVTEDDYDAVIAKGWSAWVDDFFYNRLGYKREDMAEFAKVKAVASAERAEAGLFEILNAPVGAVTPFNSFMGGRGIANIARDMKKIPEKMEEAFKIITDEGVAAITKALQAGGIHAVFNGGARASGDYISQKNYERFVWPTTQRTAWATIDGGSRVWFHLDTNWESRFPYFKEFPKGKTIFVPDGETNIFNIKRELGDRMCITGDVPPAMLTIGTPEECYNYAAKLIKEIGPEGFIMAAGCCIPPNAKNENMEAVVAACLGK